MKKILVALLFFFSIVSFSQNTEKFEQGKAHYKKGDYEAAITAWKSILESGEHSASLYYNLGNAYYKIDHIAPSIYFYEKALQLSPNDREIKNNLAFAQNRTIDAIEPLPENIFTIGYKKLLHIFTFDGWALASVFLALGFSFLFLRYYFSKETLRKRFYFTFSLAMLFFSVCSLTLAFLSYEKSNKERIAIIFAQSTQVRSEPFNRSDVSFVLHEGTKVKIIGEDDGWKRILLDDGKEGWMQKNDLKEL